MKRIVRRLAALVSGLGIGCTALPLLATPTPGSSRDCSVPTTVTEVNFGGSPKNFTLHISGPGGFGAPDLAAFPLGTIPSGGSVVVNVPALGQTNCDARNEITSLGGGVGIGAGGLGAKSDLLIEAIFLDATTGTFQFESYGELILNSVAYGSSVKIPDLWAVHPNGEFIAGVTLYSYVNLEDYLAVPLPVYAPNQLFSIVNGQVAGLTGMRFSSTPFTFSATAGVGGTPYNGTGAVFTEHGVTAIPEPSESALMLAGLVALLARWMPRRASRGAAQCSAGPDAGDRRERTPAG
jgi:hypothetical protein